MFAVLQFPIADTRSLAAHPYVPLLGPEFPNAALTYPPRFIKSFGPVTKRNLGPDASWKDEWVYCRANRALRFPLDSDLNLPLRQRESAPRLAFKRFYSNGNLVNRIELGLDLHEFNVTPQQHDWATLFRSLLIANAGVRNLADPDYSTNGKSGPAFFEGPLVKQGFRLARLFTDATSKDVDAVNRQEERALVEAGQPLLLVECNHDQFDLFARRGQRIDMQSLADMQLAWVSLKPTKDQAITVWVIGRPAYRPAPQQIRTLRLAIMRLHAARQCFDSLLRQMSRERIAYDPGSDRRKRFDDILLEGSRAVTRPAGKSVVQSQTGILAAFDAMAQSPDAVDLARLEEQLRGVRRQTAEKILAYERNKLIESGVPLTIEEFVMYREGDIQVTNNGDNVIMQTSREGGTMENITITVNKDAASKVDAAALETALTELSAALMRSSVPDDKKLDAVTAVGTAKKDGLSKPDRLVEHLADAGKILAESNTTIEEGKSLWSSIKNVAEVLAPVVGTAAMIGKLFGLAF